MEKHHVYISHLDLCMGPLSLLSTRVFIPSYIYQHGLIDIYFVYCIRDTCHFILLFELFQFGYWGHFLWPADPTGDLFIMRLK